MTTAKENKEITQLRNDVHRFKMDLFSLKNDLGNVKAELEQLHKKIDDWMKTKKRIDVYG